MENYTGLQPLAFSLFKVEKGEFLVKVIAFPIEKVSKCLHEAENGREKVNLQHELLR